MALASGSTKSLSSFKERLAKLHSKRTDAARLNHTEVVEEDRVSKLPKNAVKKRERLESELRQEEERQAATKEGRDYDRQQLLQVSAVDAERWERKRKKKNPDSGFSTYEDATKRQYDRLIKGFQVDTETYQREKESLGEAAFYGEDNTISIGLHKDSHEAIDSMAEDLEKQILKRSKYSRRRTYDDDDDINYINDRNAKFNKKLERFYGEFTQETKQNLERGTAV